MNKFLKWTLIWTAFFFSLGYSIPSLAAADSSAFFSSFILSLIILLLLFFGGAYLYSNLRKRLGQSKPEQEPNQHRKLVLASRFRLNGRRVFWILFVCLFVSWIPAFLAFYPGTFGADAPIQLAMFQNKMELTLHHPLVHTMALGILYSIGSFIFQSPAGGIAFYILVFQILFTAYALARTSAYLYQKGVPFFLLFVMLEILAFNPIVQAAVCYTTKDIPFAAALLLFVSATCEFLYPVRVPKNKKMNGWRRRILPFIGWGVLMCLLRNQGIYMVLAGTLFLAVVFWKEIRKKKIQRAVAANVLIVILAVFLGSSLPSMFSIPKGDSREMFSVPIQQIAAAIYKDETDHRILDDQTRSEALSYFDFESLAGTEFNPFSADYAKNFFKTDLLKENPGKFLSVYFRIIRSDFNSALTSTAYLIAPYFDMRTSPFNPLIVVTSFEEYWPEGLEEEASQSSLLPGYLQWLNDTIWKTIQKDCPLWLRLFDPALVLYFMVFLFGFGIFYQKKLVLTAEIYPVLYALTMLLGPVALLRYSYVYVIEAPFLAGVFWISLKNQNKDCQPVKG